MMSTEAARTVAPQSARLTSLDVFRGMTIAGMIVVNDPGTWEAVYPQLEHADWFGWTLADLVFPFFLFIIGMSMVLSFAARLRRGGARRELLLHTVRRAAVIYLIGLFIEVYPFTNFAFGHMRLTGVLQRIAVCYLLSSIVYLYTSRRARVGITFAVLVAYWAALQFVPVPEFGAGDLSPEGNLVSYIDRVVLGTHMWKPTFDPEGLLSSLPATCTVLLGTFAIEWMQAQESVRRRALGLFASGAALSISGIALDRWMPMSKNLWTPTYVLLTAGLAVAIVAALHVIIDVRGQKRWAWPFEVFGLNAILSYAFATLVMEQIIATHVAGTSLQDAIYRHIFEPLATPLVASLLFALAYTALIWLLMLWPYRKRIFVKI